MSIESIEANGVAGVRAFLDDLAAELKTGNYRPKALRRVYIPKAGDRRVKRRDLCRYPRWWTGWL